MDATTRRWIWQRRARMLLLGSSAEPPCQHLNPHQCAASCNIQGFFLRTSERQILAPACNTPDRDDAKMLTTRAHHLDTGFGERIHAAVFIDDKTVGVGDWRFGR